MTETPRTVDLGVAVAHAERLLEAEPALALEQAREILRAAPDLPQAELIAAGAERRLGRPDAALGVLERLTRTHAKAPAAWVELAFARASLAKGSGALAALRRAVELNPSFGARWLALGDALAAAGEAEAADEAYGRHVAAAAGDPEMLQAAGALYDNKLAIAERLLKSVLKRRPTDVAAIRMLSEVAARLGRYEDAEALLTRCLALAPSFAAARHNLATIKMRRNRPDEAIVEIDQVLASAPRHPSARALKAAALGRVGEYQGAIDLYESILKDYPAQAKVWMSYGHVLKTVGRTPESIVAYRESASRLPSLGEAYWSLANLKTFRFEAFEIEAMTAALTLPDLADDDRLHLHYALGKAFEDQARYEDSFRHYAEGAAIRRAQVRYDPEVTAAQAARMRGFFTAERLAGFAGLGHDAPDPIFVVGLPRAGSTLVEQILSSHSQIEGTMELPDLIAISARLAGPRKRAHEGDYPDALATLAGEDLAALGREYLDRTRVQRKSGAPLFIDKMPNNWMHVGLILTILPNAKIIDARRHPLGCCFSGFKQHFARGQAFSYSLDDVGRYYRDYVELMAHFDAVAPGRVHRVIYERMVDEPEREIRALLDYCGVDFETECLHFHESDRAVRTASSEQVRQPLYRSGVSQWLHYEPWLGPLKSALGPVLTHWDQN